MAGEGKQHQIYLSSWKPEIWHAGASENPIKIIIEKHLQTMVLQISRKS